MRKVIKKILKDRDKISKLAIADYLKLLKEARKKIELEIKLAEAWDAQYLSRIRNNVDNVIFELTRKNIEAQNRTNSELWALGQSKVDEPLLSIGVSTGLGDISETQLLALETVRREHFLGLSSEMVGRINAIITQGVLGGVSPFNTFKNVERILETRGYDGERIMRTEMGRSMETSSQIRMQQARQYVPGLRKVWLIADYELVRISHARANNQVQDVDKPFLIFNERTGKTEKMMHPLDTKARAELVVGCRCISSPYIQGKF